MKILSGILFYFGIFYFFLFSSCNANNSQQATNTNGIADKKIIDTDSVFRLDDKFNEAKQVVYSLPSPQEISIILLDNKKITFDPSFMSDYQDVDKYTSDLARALNMGIYLADITYATLFDQNQLAVNYMASAKKIAQDLGVLDYFTESDIQQIEDNLTNRDEVMHILTEAYMKADANLQEDKRDDIAALVLIGGWIEGMYLAVNLTGCNIKSNPELVSSIMEQQLSLALLVDFLHYYDGNKFLSEVAYDIYKLDDIFQSINTNIDQNGNIIVSEKDFEKICKMVNKIRNSYTNLL